MKRTLTSAALVLAAAATICAAPASAMSARDGDKRHLLRLRLRPGDEWRERVLHEVEVVDGSGTVVRVLRTERVETVLVLSLVTDLGTDLATSRDATTYGPARRWVRVRRTPEPTAELVAEGSSLPEPYEILVSSLGEIALPPPEDGQPADDAARAALMAGLVSRFVPVLPEARLAVGEKASRVMSMRFASGARSTPAFVETETVTLESVGATDEGGAARGDVAVLTIARRAEPQTVPLADSGLAAPKPGAPIANASIEDLDVKVLGASGVGELTFDATRGVMLSYRVRETLGIAAKLGGASIRRTINVTFEIERLE